jgi:Icc-related predicted phosphoesterase
MARVFFATDIHGSEVCWRKFLNAGAFYHAYVLILGGDMTGKALVPIVQDGDRYEVAVQEHQHVLESEEEVQEIETRISARGYYPVRLSPAEVAEMRANPSAVDALFRQQILSTIERWMTLAEQKLSGTGIRCYVCPGNDDLFDVDKVIAARRRWNWRRAGS